MEDFIWTSDFSLGHQALDDEHEELFGRIGDLFQDLSQHVGDMVRFETCMNEIYSCMADHFKFEEDLMEGLRYPGLDTHKSEHEQLLERLGELARSLMARPNYEFMEDLERELKGWIVQHVTTLDVELAQALNQ